MRFIKIWSFGGELSHWLGEGEKRENSIERMQAYRYDLAFESHRSALVRGWIYSLPPEISGLMGRSVYRKRLENFARESGNKPGNPHGYYNIAFLRCCQADH